MFPKVHELDLDRKSYDVCTRQQQCDGSYICRYPDSSEVKYCFDSDDDDDDDDDDDEDKVMCCFPKKKSPLDVKKDTYIKEDLSPKRNIVPSEPVMAKNAHNHEPHNHSVINKEIKPAHVHG